MAALRHLSYLKFAFLFLAGIMLCSCGTGIRMRALLGGKLQVTTDVSVKANENNPIAVDLILVYNEKLLEDLIKMPSKEWFKQKYQIRRDYPEEEGFEFRSWEWVPGQQIPIQVLPLKPAAKAVLIFADYLTPGPHRSRTDPFSDIVIHLGEKDFYVETVKY
jgi:type VI secretion system protein